MPTPLEILLREQMAAAQDDLKRASRDLAAVKIRESFTQDPREEFGDILQLAIEHAAGGVDPYDDDAVKTAAVTLVSKNPAMFTASASDTAPAGEAHQREAELRKRGII